MLNNSLLVTLLHRALFAFMIALPICFGSFGLLVFYWGFLILFVVLAIIVLQTDWLRQIKGLYQRHPRFAIVFLLWVASMTLSLLWVWLSPDVSQLQLTASALRYTYDVTMILFVLVIFVLSRQSNFGHYFLYQALSLGFILMLLIQLHAYFIVGVPGGFWFGNPPMGPHVRDQGNLACVVLVSMVAYYLFAEQKKYQQLFCLLSICIASAFVIWSGGRMAMMASSITIFSLFILAWLFRKLTLTHGWLACLLLLGVGLGQWFSVFDWNGFLRPTQLTAVIEMPASGDALNKLTTGRLAMWKMSLQAFWQQPWFGLGPYGYFFIAERTYDDQPHNFIIQFLVEWGIVGTCFVLLMMLVLMALLIKRLRYIIESKQTDIIASLAVVMVLTIHGLTGGTYFKIQPLTCLALAYGCLLTAVLINKSHCQLDSINARDTALLALK